ncbi:cytochrome-c peroxidase [Emticicia sp. SJ17W-69]|uniref:cytochrome-c peroxidase n=1 Tax=Emticicia sp. SJ17W-69 TaxID=3421657 RepID=UPI003EBAC203
MKKILLVFVLVCFSLSVFFACKKEKEVIIQPTVIDNSDNNSSVTIQYLGKLLFYDPILSGKKDVACATCHHPDFAYADGRDLSIGVDGIGLGPNRHFLISTFTKRKSQTILNTAFNGMDENGKYDSTNAPMFWDSRAKSLEEQALIPIKSSVEMRADTYPEDLAIDSVLARIKNIKEYRTLFATIFSGQQQSITSSNLAKAIAAFERSLTAMNAPYDRYMRGEIAAMTDLQIQGMSFFQINGCGRCHTGNMFSDYKLHVLSVPDNPKAIESDNGSNGTYAFRTMSLRNVKLTAPYMHSGVFKTLDEVFDFYNLILNSKSRNPNVPNTKIDPLATILRPNNTSRTAIKAFIEALTDEKFDRSMPKTVPSGLNVGGNIK